MTGWGDASGARARPRGRWAGRAAGLAALAALGSRPRRARRAGLGLRGGAGTGSGKQQCGGGGGGVLPLQEPSAGRRAGAAASRDRGRGARTAGAEVSPARGRARRRGGGRGAQIFGGETPPARIPHPNPRTQPRVHRPPPASHSTDRTPCVLPWSHCSLIPARCTPPAPAPALRSPPHPTSSGPHISSPRLGRPLLP